MHKNILNQNQLELLPLLIKFKRTYYLAGGTAIALYLGHRRSIDFDLFRNGTINHSENLKKIEANKNSVLITRRVTEQMNLIINEVKFTFFQYPYNIVADNIFENCFKLPSLLDLAAMKAFALGRRSKWKDYVDIYFLLINNITITEISNRASQLYGDQFSEKLFRAQLCYFEDIDYSEEVDYICTPVPNEFFAIKVNRIILLTF